MVKTKNFSNLQISSILYKNENYQFLQRMLAGNYFMSKSMLTVTQYNITGLKVSFIKHQLSS